MITKVPPSSFDLPLFQRKTLTMLQWCAVLMGASVPVSVALDNVLLGILLLGALFSVGSIARIGILHPVARTALLLFSALFIATFYGNAPLREAFAILGKYFDLAFIPILVFLFFNETVRRRARYAFLTSMGIILLLSLLVGFRLLSPQPWMVSFPNAETLAAVPDILSQIADNPVIFHSHITQNNMMAFAVFLALLEARGAATLGRRVAWAMFASLGAVNVLFMVQGRTGYGILLLLLGWFAWTTLSRRAAKQGRSWGWRQGIAVGLACITLAASAYFASPRLHERVALIASEYHAWRAGGSDVGSSIGQRLSFYSNTLQIISEHPLLGAGTGGFAAAYEQQAQGQDVMKTHNPHNEYLMIAVQTGVVGLALLLYLFYTQWRYAPSLPSAFEQDAARGLVLAYALNCALNSSLLDHADGLFFAFMTAVLFAGMKLEKKHG